jgi:hypothetical protein
MYQTGRECHFDLSWFDGNILTSVATFLSILFIFLFFKYL